MATAEETEKIENEVAQCLLDFTSLVEQLGVGGAREGMAQKADTIIAALQALKAVLPSSTAKSALDGGFKWPLDLSADVAARRKAAKKPAITAAKEVRPAKKGR